MRDRRPFVAAVIMPISIILIATCCSKKDSLTYSELRASIALLGEFETVVFSRPQLLFSSDSVKHLSKEYEANGLRWPFVYLWQGLDYMKKGSSVSVLANSTAVMVGAKDFMPPNGIGYVRSQQCYIVVLRNRNTIELSNIMHSAPITFVGGMPVLAWSAMLNEFGENDNAWTPTIYSPKKAWTPIVFIKTLCNEGG
jgi:hypothetical protein